MEAQENNLGFESRKSLYSALENIILRNLNTPAKAEIVGITALEKDLKHPNVNENSEIYTVTARISTADERAPKDYTLKKYNQSSKELMANEKYNLFLAEKLVPFTEYPFSKERKIRLFPKILKDMDRDFDAKGIILTETLTEPTLYELSYEKNIFWDQISIVIDPVVLFEILAYRAKKSNDFSDRFADINFENRMLRQKKVHPGHNNLRSLIDASEIVEGSRSEYLGGLLGHPFIFKKIDGLPKRAYEGYLWRRTALKEKPIAELDIALYDIDSVLPYNETYESFESGFYRGAAKSNAERASILKNLKTACDDEKKAKIENEITELENLAIEQKSFID